MPMRGKIVGLVVIGVLMFGSQVGCSPPPVTGGDSTAGQQDYSQLCTGCHTAASVRGNASRVTNNMGTVDSAMNGITLTDQQVADIQAYLRSL
jgi:mono/diheme cytochrome c family protein